MTAILDAEPKVESSVAPAALPTPIPRGRRARAPRGLLMQRAIHLRDEMPSGRRRADIPRWRSWTQIMVGLSLLTVGITTLYSIGPAWSWLGALATGVGPTVTLLGVIDLARRGDQGERPPGPHPSA